jgi:O-antigen ligase/tetratricopeptide (TPR) repeat protein
MIGLMAAGLASLVAVSIGLELQGRQLRMGLALLAPLAFVVVPLLQSVPLPLGVRSIFDRNGTALLRDNQLVATSSWPLSLDPPNTRVNVGCTALALVAFLIAYHLASGQSRRHFVTRALGVAGIVAVFIGLGHRIFGIGMLYGAFNASPRSLLVGPFVNSNHTAEFLELAAFVCLACSFQRPTALNRIGWLVGTLLCAGGAAATLSRGAVLALTTAVLMFMFLRYFSSDGDGTRRRRVSLAWGALLAGLVLLGAGALGADHLIERFKADSVTTDVRLHLWREALRVFAAHPFGIGRGAFDRVFPIYRSFTMPYPVRFAFTESEPLQLLIDCGLFFSLVLVAGLGLVAWQIARRGRRDQIEAALIAGLFAVLVHSTVDFGLETLGVLLPFVAVLGVVLGRCPSPATAWPRSPGVKWGVVGLAAGGLVFGIASAARGSYDNFDALLKRPMKAPARQALLVRAEDAHPLDYFYALDDARLRPLKGTPGSPASPRLHALNRALRLCPACETVHVEVARNLWHLGLRRQSILEWRTAVDLQPVLFAPTLSELFAAGAKPEELAAVASASTARMLDLVAFLTRLGRLPDAFVVLDQADALGAPRSESLLARAALQLRAGQPAAAAATVESAAAAGVQDPRLPVLRAKLLTNAQGAAGADEALAILDLAAARYPTDLDIERARLEVVTQYQRWKAAARALDGLKLALYHSQGSASEAHVAGARIEGQLGHWTGSLDEYRLALMDQPDNVALWIEYARAAETTGRDNVARDALAEAARLSPNSPDITGPVRELEARQARLRALVGDGVARTTKE